MWSTSDVWKTVTPREERADDYLGPAEVLEIHPNEVRVALAGGRAVPAQMALAVPYSPALGDLLLVIGKRDAHYVIGVLRGKGKTQIALQGDIDIAAEGGQLRLSGDKGVQIVGAEVGIETSKLRVVAGSLMEHLASAVRRVSGLLSVQVKDAHTVAEGSIVSQAKSTAILSEEAVMVNGKQVHLG